MPGNTQLAKELMNTSGPFNEYDRRNISWYLKSVSENDGLLYLSIQVYMFMLASHFNSSICTCTTGLTPRLKLLNYAICSTPRMISIKA